VHAREASDGFGGATTSGADGGDDVKKSHGRRGRLQFPGGLLHGLYLSRHPLLRSGPTSA
jgi:hypothetical protein